MATDLAVARGQRTPLPTAELLVRAVRARAAAQGFALDPGQEVALEQLAALAAALVGDPTRVVPRGVYVWGPVGRGKTWLVDALVAELPERPVRLRVHFHDLYTRLHRGVGRHLGDRGALAAALDELLAGVRLLVLDELHLHDPDDAWLAWQLLQRLYASGGAVVATSNYPPEGLLPDPRRHADAEPLIALLRDRAAVVALDGGHDYRTRAGAGRDRPGFTAGAYLLDAGGLAPLGLLPPRPVRSRELTVHGRAFPVLADDGDRLWLDAMQVCERPTAPADYLTLAATYRTWVLLGVRPLARLSPFGRQRFVQLVDVLHDADVRPVLVAEAPLAELLAVAEPPPDLGRTASRLGLLAPPGGG